MYCLSISIQKLPPLILTSDWLACGTTKNKNKTATRRPQGPAPAGRQLPLGQPWTKDETDETQEPWLGPTCVYYRWVIRRVKIVPTASPSSLGTNLGVHSKSPGYCLGTKFFVSQLLGHSLSLVRKWDKSCMNTVINLITLITLTLHPVYSQTSPKNLSSSK